MRKLFLIALLLLLGYLVYLVFRPFLVPLTWAAVLVVIFFPVHRWVSRRIRGANRAALASTFLLTALIVIPMLTVATAFATQAIGLAQRVQEEWQAGQLPLDRLLDDYRRAADLLNFCRTRLAAVEQQVQVLEDGQLKAWSAGA